MLLAFSFIVGNSMKTDAVGIFAGHIYYYFEDVWPEIARIRNWRMKRPFKTPRFM